MTLLVVHIELPEGFEPTSNQEFLNRLSGLSDTFIAYLIAFFVLVSFWFGRAKEIRESEMVPRSFPSSRVCSRRITQCFPMSSISPHHSWPAWCIDGSGRLTHRAEMRRFTHRLSTGEAMIPSRVGRVQQVPAPVDLPDASAEQPGSDR